MQIFPSIHLDFAKEIMPAAAVALLCLTTFPAQAQWSTSYLTPQVLASGNGTYAASIVTTANGNVVTAYDQVTSNVRRLRAARFAPNGESLPPGNVQDKAGINIPVAKVDLFPAANNIGNGFAIAMGEARTAVGARNNMFKYYDLDASGNSTSELFLGYDYAYKAACLIQDRYRLLGYRGDTREINLWDGLLKLETPYALGSATPSDISLVHVGDKISLTCLTKTAPTAGTPSEVWTFAYNGAIQPRAIGQPAQAESQPGVFQSKGKLLQIGDEEIMLTWLGNDRTSQSLYVKKLDTGGAEVDDTDHVMSNVTDYAITTSTLGTPVYAFVQKDPLEASPVGTLYGGLLDPASGFSLNLPLATGADIKIKTVRQEDNGDFSLVYSVLENETTLLKVRRISGTTGMTLWESTVADLGLAPADRIEEYNNAFVSAKDNVLFILTRYDRPYTNHTEFRLVRVREDGQLGADPLQAPINVSATQVTGDQVKVAWNPASNSETHYVIARTEQGVEGLQIMGTVAANTLNYTDTTTQAGKTYTYYVAAYQSHNGDYVASQPETITLNVIFP